MSDRLAGHNPISQTSEGIRWHLDQIQPPSIQVWCSRGVNEALNFGMDEPAREDLPYFVVDQGALVTGSLKAGITREVGIKVNLRRSETRAWAR